MVPSSELCGEPGWSMAVRSSPRVPLEAAEPVIACVKMPIILSLSELVGAEAGADAAVPAAGEGCGAPPPRRLENRALKSIGGAALPAPDA